MSRCGSGAAQVRFRCGSGAASKPRAGGLAGTGVPEAHELVVQHTDPLQDAVSRLLLLLTRGVLDHVEAKGLAIADRHARELQALPVANLVGAEDRHRDDRGAGLERQAPDPRPGLLGELPGARAPAPPAPRHRPPPPPGP